MEELEHLARGRSGADGGALASIEADPRPDAREDRSGGLELRDELRRDALAALLEPEALDARLDRAPEERAPRLVGLRRHRRLHARVQLLEDARHAREARGADVAQNRQDLGRLRAEVGCPAEEEAQPVAARSLGGVRERQIRDDARVRRGVLDAAVRFDHPEDRPVGVHDALGWPRRSGRVDQRGQVVGRHALPRRIEGACVTTREAGAALDEGAPRRHPRIGARPRLDHDHSLETWEVPANGQEPLEEGGVLDEGDLRLAVASDVTDLLR